MAWIRLEPDAVAAITRDYLEDPVRGDGPSGTSRPTTRLPTFRQDDADLARRLRADDDLGARAGGHRAASPRARPTPSIRPYPVPTTTFGWAAGDAAYAMGAFELADDEALVIRGRSPECVFWNMCLWNRLLHTYNYDYERVTDQRGPGAVRAGRVVDHRRVARNDPAHPNWVSTAGHRKGRIWFRWFLPAETPGAARRSRSLPGGHAYERSPGAGPDRRPGRAPVLRRGPGHPRLHGRGRVAARRSTPPRLMARPQRGDRAATTSAPTDFVHRLDVLCRAMREEGGFNGGRHLPAAHAASSGLLKNRLLIEDLVRRHPEILDERITAPIVICGLPADGDDPPAQPDVGRPGPALAPLLGEPRAGPGRERAARPAERPIRGMERTALALSFLDVAMPYFNRMHEMTVDHTHEEIQLLAIDFSSMLFETTAPMPTWRDAYLARDQRPELRLPGQACSRCCSGCGAGPAGCSSRPSTSSSSRSWSTSSPTPPSSSPTATRSR